MNVGIFSDLYRPDVNGTAVSIDTFERELTRQGHRVAAFAPTPVLFGRLGPRHREGYVRRFHSVNYPPYPGFRVSFPLYGPVKTDLERLALDVLHSHTPFSMGIFATRISYRRRVPHVHTFHTRWPQYARHYMPGPAAAQERLMRGWIRTFANLADRLVTPSEPIRDRLVADGVRTPIDVIPTPVGDDAFENPRDPSRVRRRHGIPEGAPLLLAVTRLGREKSVDFLVRSFAGLTARRPDARMLLVGDGPARGELETLAERLGVAEQVVFAGEIADRAEVLASYAAADVFVCASRTETQCLTMLEAAAAGLPLVARLDDPLATALETGVNGTFVPDGERDFAEAVEALLASPSRAQAYGRESLAIARAHGTAKRGEQLVASYERARLSAARGRSGARP